MSLLHHPHFPQSTSRFQPVLKPVGRGAPEAVFSWFYPLLFPLFELAIAAKSPSYPEQPILLKSYIFLGRYSYNNNNNNFSRKSKFSLGKILQKKLRLKKFPRTRKRTRDQEQRITCVDKRGKNFFIYIIRFRTYLYCLGRKF